MRFYDRGGILWVDICQKGKRTRKSLGVPYNKANIKRCTLELTRQLASAPNLFVAPTDYETYKERMLLWAKSNLKPQTLDSYAEALRRGEMFLKIADLNSVGPFDAEIACKKMQEAGYSTNSIAFSMAMFSFIFKEAQRCGVVINNPISLARKPKMQRKEYPAFDTEQAKLLLNCSKGKLRIFLYIAFYAGARAGEILGLRYSDIDFENNTISIERQKTLSHGFSSPKTGPRTIALLEPLKDFLRGFLISDKEACMVKATYASMLMNFKKLLVQNNLPITGLHSTRRTFIRLAMKHGADLAMIQKMVGHKDLHMINSVYSGFVEELGDREKMGKALAY